MDTRSTVEEEDSVEGNTQRKNGSLTICLNITENAVSLSPQLTGTRSLMINLSKAVVITIQKENELS